MNTYPLSSFQGPLMSLSLSKYVPLDESEGTSKAREKEVSVIKDDEEDEKKEEDDDEFDWSSEFWEETMRDGRADEEKEEEHRDEEEEEENRTSIQITSFQDAPIPDEELKTLKFLIASINSRFSELASDFLMYCEAKEQESVLQRLLIMLKLDALEARNQRLEAIVLDHQRNIGPLVNMRSELKSLQRKVEILSRSNDVHVQEEDQLEEEHAGERE